MTAQTQLVHHVFFWLKNAGSAEDRAKLVEGLRTLNAIEVIRQAHIGLPAATDPRGPVDNSWDVSEMFIFDTVEDEAVYQPHPVHQAFIANYGHLWSKVVVYDAISA